MASHYRHCSRIPQILANDTVVDVLDHAGEYRHSFRALSPRRVSWPVRYGRPDHHASAPGAAVTLVGSGDVRGGFLLPRLRARDVADHACRSNLLAPSGVHRHSVDPGALGSDWTPALRPAR